MTFYQMVRLAALAWMIATTMLLLYLANLVYLPPGPCFACGVAQILGGVSIGIGVLMGIGEVRNKFKPN